MKNDTTSPCQHSVKDKAKEVKKYEIRIDKNDPKAPYKIFKFEYGVWFPVCRFYPLCDAEAREIREILDRGQGA